MQYRKVSIPDDVVSAVLEEETVVLDLVSGEYYTLNAVGTRAWELIEEHGRLEAVRDALLEEFDVTHESLVGDLDTWLGELAKLGLVVLS